MSQEELQKALAEEAALEAKLKLAREMRQSLQEDERLKVEKEKRQAEIERPIILTVSALSGGNLMLVGPYRVDLVEVYQSTPGRSYRGGEKNLIPLNEWPRCEGRLLERGNVTIKWAKGVQEEVDWYVTAPPWEVDIHPSDRHFLAKPGPREAQTRILGHIPGAEWSWNSKDWKIGLAEGWRIFEALSKVEGVVYSDRAQKLILGQVEKRGKLDEVARKEDTDFITHLNGNKLRPFQKVGIEFIHSANGRVLLADATGLGKTWQALGYAEKMRETDPAFQTIIVAKAANIPNWKREIKRLTGEDVVLCVGGKPDFFVLQQVVTEKVPYSLISYDTLGIKREVGEEEECPFDRGEAHDAHVGCYECNGTGKVTKTKIVYPWTAIFKGAKADLLVLDEAHQIKNPDANRSKAARLLTDIPHILPMTASPILNRMSELWMLLFMLDPQVFKSNTAFLNAYTWGGQVPKNVEKLHEMMRPMFLRRRKKDVLKDLPPINKITHYHELSSRARHLYEKALKGVYQQLAEYDPYGIGGAEMSIMSILAKITRLKQICAADKTEFTAELATDLIDQANGEEENGKVLIFSQFKGTALSIANMLGHEAICTVRRTPSGFVSLDAIKRDEMFEAARDNPDVKYVVTTEAAKEGHNLEFCNWVIFNDPLWTPAGHLQCEGRAYGRLSDPHPIDSIYVIADIEIERWIMDLLDKKRAIIEEGVDGVETSRDVSGSVARELIKRMKEEMWKR